MGTTFDVSWSSVIKEAGKQSLKYSGRTALGFIIGIVCKYFGYLSVILLTKSSKIIKCGKICHSICSSGRDIGNFVFQVNLMGYKLHYLKDL